MSKECCGSILPTGNNQIEVLIQQLKREIKNLIDSTNKNMLCQNKKIANLQVYVKDNLANTIRSLLDDLQQTGQLDAIITGTILADITDLENEINNLVIFYGKEIYTDSLYDEESSTHYYITHVPTKDSKNNPIRFQLGIANDDMSFSSLESNLHFADRKNATLSINAGYYNVNTYKPFRRVDTRRKSYI